MLCWQIAVSVGTLLVLLMSRPWWIVAVPLCLIAVSLAISRFKSAGATLVGGGIAALMGGLAIAFDDVTMRVDGGAAVVTASIACGLYGAAFAAGVYCMFRGKEIGKEFAGLIICMTTVVYWFHRV